MPVKNAKVDDYLKDGCGRCPLFKTPECRVHDWQKELKLLRSIVLDCGLKEELKWSMPCYTFEGNNVCMISAFKQHAALSFFKGSLLKDEHLMLDKPGENSQSARLLRFTSVKAIREVERQLRDYIADAIQVEQSGKKVEFKAKNELVYPQELEDKFDSLPALRAAFAALTPGRQRGYILYFNGAKQSATKHSRIEKCIPNIMEGRGMHD